MSHKANTLSPPETRFEDRTVGVLFPSIHALIKEPVA
jgi:hypothetical protein